MTRFVLVLATISGCAAGEASVGDPGDPLALGAQPDPLRSEIYVDVADESGRPMAADAVWISVGVDEPAPARCMGRACDTWVARVVAEDEATAYAEVCGFLYLEPLEMASVDAVHVTVTADSTSCAPQRRSPDAG